MKELLRRYKLTYKVYNFFKKKQLHHNIKQYKKYGLNKKYYSSISSEDFKNIKSPINIHDAKDSIKEMPKNPDFNSLDKKTKDQLLSWSKDGYVIVKNFFSEQEVDLFNAEVDLLIENKKANFRYLNKIMFAMHDSKIILNSGTNKKLLKILKILLGQEVELFQSINFLTGSQQRTHSDFIHMTTFPFGNLIAVWVALEDITSDCGPLHYYSGSHKLPYVLNREFGNVGTKYKLGEKTYADYENHIETLIEEKKLKKEIFLAKKGDILIWHANLLHGGEAVINKKSSRKSMVFHYYAKEAICFHEVTQRPALKNRV
jgi:hypothetical protein